MATRARISDLAVEFKLDSMPRTKLTYEIRGPLFFGSCGKFLSQFDVARDAAMRRQLAQLRVEQRAEESEWGSLPGEDAAGGDGLLSEEFVDEMRAQLDAISADYAKMLDGFLNLLPLQTHVDLKFLLFRLDFSEYYQRR